MLATVLAGDLARRLVEPALWGLAAVALLVGAYHMGKRAERVWWRTELAAKTAAVKSAMDRAGVLAEVEDARLIAALGETDARLRLAEDALSRVVRTPAQPAPTGDVCRPIPAECLRK